MDFHSLDVRGEVTITPREARAQSSVRLVANSVNGIYLRAVLEEVRLADSCEGVNGAVAHLTSADDLIKFCAEANISMKLFCPV